MQPLPYAFYERETDRVARALLGATLIRVIPPPAATADDPVVLAGRIVETEAYLGPEDSASHARSGVTPRTEVMFGPVGHAYVYFTYGMHWMLNVVARRNQPAGAVLLRAVEPLAGLDLMRAGRDGRPDRELTNGPAKLCQAFGVTKELNCVDLCDPKSSLIVTSGTFVPEDGVGTGPRVGIQNTSEPWRSRLLRYWVRGNRFVSR